MKLFRIGKINWAIKIKCCWPGEKKATGEAQLDWWRKTPRFQMSKNSEKLLQITMDHFGNVIVVVGIEWILLPTLNFFLIDKLKTSLHPHPFGTSKHICTGKKQLEINCICRWITQHRIHIAIAIIPFRSNSIRVCQRRITFYFEINSLSINYLSCKSNHSIRTEQLSN